MTEDFSTYYSLVLDRLEARDGTPFPSGSQVHAAILLEAMFCYAATKICILTGVLNARVYGTGPVIDRALQFLSTPNHSLEIIFDEDPDEISLVHHPLLRQIGRRDNFSIWKIQPEFRSSVPAHFTIMDDDSYRFEPNKTEPSAVAAFGDKEFTTTLVRIFDLLKVKACKPGEIPSLADISPAFDC